MVWDALLDALVGFLSAVLGPLFDLVPDVPDWVSGDGLNDVVEQLAGVDRWLPVSYAANVAAAVVTAYVTAGFIGVSRSMLSHITGGGGAS